MAFHRNYYKTKQLLINNIKQMSCISDHFWCCSSHQDPFKWSKKQCANIHHQAWFLKEGGFLTICFSLWQPVSLVRDNKEVFIRLLPIPVSYI